MSRRMLSDEFTVYFEPQSHLSCRDNIVEQNGKRGQRGK